LNGAFYPGQPVVVRTGPKSVSARDRARGSALIEITLLAPWIFFLLSFVIYMGFSNYALIAVENAARVAAEYTSSSTTAASDQAGACTLIRSELAMLPGLSSITSCNSAPLTVTVQSVTGTDGAAATSVVVSYRGLRLIPVPGFPSGPLYVTRSVQMRVKT
jgi:Flp pilus assembly protein TadG